MSELPLGNVPSDITAAAHDAAERGQVIYLTDASGNRIAAIVPAGMAAEIEEDLADAEIARKARASIKAGEPLIPWEQVKAEADL